MQFGFILTRHVNSERTNRYWNQCVKLIRTFYPHRPIVIIDDNSTPEFVKADHVYRNVTVIQSEYPQRGEILPYVYLLRHKWFPSAVIIHDSVFIHRRIPFETFAMPVLPLWHHAYDKENLDNLVRIAFGLKNSSVLVRELRGAGPDLPILGNGIKSPKSEFDLCFGCQVYIQLSFLERLEHKYQLTNLVNVVRCRRDRCGLERVLGLLFSLEYPKLKRVHSLFGDIMRFPAAFSYDYERYQADVSQKRVPRSFVKVWTGR